MLAKTRSVTPYGSKVIPVGIETYMSKSGFPSFDIIGLASKEVSESKQRVITSIKSSGIKTIPCKIIVNLTPADIPKKGSSYDLPIALSLLALYKKVPPLASNTLFFGELSLDGSLRYTPGAFLLSLYAFEHGIKNIFLPNECISEIYNYDGLNVFSVSSLTDIIKHFSKEQIIPPSKIVSGNRTYKSVVSTQQINSQSKEFGETVFNSILGQDLARSMLVLSAAGKHSVLLTGSPGTGKTLLCESYSELLPPLKEAESLEVTRLYSLANITNPTEPFKITPPFRSPHHTISYAGMVGGGAIPKPGEISLAHRGVLFLDEFPEYSRDVLEALRQPLESGLISVGRSLGTFEFPSDFTLLATANPCPCGYLNHPSKSCTCTYGQISTYNRKLSGPLLDRIDLHLALNPVEIDSISKVSKSKVKSTSKCPLIGDLNLYTAFSAICASREIQQKRYVGQDYKYNSKIPSKQLSKWCPLTSSAHLLLNEASQKMHLSARSYTRVLKVSRTIADLDISEVITDIHITKAFLFRC